MGDAFDIYQGDAGYAAVTNPVQRQILEALREGDRQLPELVERTGRSKGTLSSHHMKELLARRLVEERPHPTDSRRKVYRLRGQKVGSSDLPMGRLKEAIHQYTGLAPLGSHVGLEGVVGALAAAPAGARPETILAQARHVGGLAAAWLHVESATEFWLRTAAFLAREGLAVPRRIDVEDGSMELEPCGALAGAGKHMPTIVAGFLDGLAEAASLEMQIRATVQEGLVQIARVRPLPAMPIEAD